MIRIEKVQMMNLDNAMRGARNPLNSWDKSDSYWENNHDDFPPVYKLGPNDLGLAKRLCAAGSDHRKFLRQVFVTMDITAPLYWWKEFDTYKVGTTANSCSTMHKIHVKQFEQTDFSVESFEDASFESRQFVLDIICVLDDLRIKYLETNDKKYWLRMIQLLPSSYNQKRTVTMTYENLINMYFARRSHKLEEWRYFCCDVLLELPYLLDFVNAIKYAKEGNK